MFRVVSWMPLFFDADFEKEILYLVQVFNDLRWFLRICICIFVFFSIDFPLSVLFILVIWFLFERGNDEQ